MRIFVWDRCWNGATAVIAKSSEEAFNIMLKSNEINKEYVLKSKDEIIQFFNSENYSLEEGTIFFTSGE